MGKMKKIKISAAKRSQHLKSKKKNTKLQIAQAKTEKLKKRENKTIEKLGSDKKHFKNNKRKKVVCNKEVNGVFNEEEIVENIQDLLSEDENDGGIDFFDVSAVKRLKTNLNDDEDSRKLEQNYVQQNLSKPDGKIEIDLLPIKSKEGEIITRKTKIDLSDFAKIQNDKYEKEIAIEEYKSDENVEYEDSDDDIVKDETVALHPNIENKKFISTADLLLLRQQEIEKQKYRIGIICSGILEKPEEKVKHFKALFNLMDEKNENGSPNFFSIRKLACISIAEVFKDILPEYRVGQVDPKMTKLRKTTLERITFENDLLQQFKKYLTKLEKITAATTKKGSNPNPNKEKLCEVAVICLCELLTSHPYFNYVQNVAQLLVYMLNCKIKNIRERVNACFKNLFETDKRLDMTLFVIRRINHLIKTKSNNVHLEMITCFLSLKIKDINLDAEKENELKVKKLENFRQRLWNMSKKERKREKKLRELNKELQETRAEENKQTLQHKLTEITKMIFTIYFRILKNDPNSKLMSACLEGLAKFAHVINFDFFTDLIEILHRLLESSNLEYREELHCIETIFAILSGQGEVLNIDPIRFYGHFYRNLFEVDAGVSSSDVPIVLRVLNDVLIKRRKNISTQRLYAFVKRTIILSLQLLHNGTLGCLGVVKILLQLSSTLDLIIDTDCTVGSGKYDPWLDDPEYCNANCTALYETILLNKHYHPTVRKFAAYIAAGAPTTGGETLPPDIAKLTVDELYDQFDSTKMAFNPQIPIPNISETFKNEFIKNKGGDTIFVENCKKILEGVVSEKIEKELNIYNIINK